VDFLSPDEVTNPGTDGVPDTVQWGVEDAAERLDGDMGVSANRLGEWGGVEVGTIHEFRVVAVSSDAVIVSVLSYPSGACSETMVASLVKERAERLVCVRGRGNPWG